MTTEETPDISDLVNEMTVTLAAAIDQPRDHMTPMQMQEMLDALGRLKVVARQVQRQSLGLLARDGTDHVEGRPLDLAVADALNVTPAEALRQLKEARDPK